MGTIAAAVAVRDVGTWDPALFAMLLVLVVGADFLPARESEHMHISGGFLGYLLAMSLLGPTAAGVIALIASVVDMARLPRDARFRPAVILNLPTTMGSPIAGGLVIAWCAGKTGLTIEDAGFLVPMTAGLVVATSVNFFLFAAGNRVLYGDPIGHQFRTIYVPLIPSEATMLLLASIIVYAKAHIGPMALLTLAGLLFLYLWLYRELLTSQERAEELDTRTHQLATLQVGVLTAMLRTLALRDHMTARHSAAVARYARELARAAGCTDDEIELVHTAGLLHDIGKFIFPDHILLADSRLSDEDWEIVKCHPFQGAKIVREVEGYGPVADIILGHHERIDGRGYPRGMRGDAIPLLARIISVCDTYDVMTARDSYREPVSAEAAIEELRRVAGKQLDARLVEIFADLVSRGELGFRHGDDADFEAELQFERRVRDYAAPQRAPLVAAA
ncbi:MAG: HD-GYP domain-containing protein [Solirubrobacteraceae bacterium]|nr:HD-GYP domain-containing protein [Solirubrobacteraceae bacterium]